MKIVTTLNKAFLLTTSGLTNIFINVQRQLD